MVTDIKISVVITTFNRKYEVRRALQSVFDQTRKADEIIVIDDYSVDGTHIYLQNFSTIIYIRNPQVMGIAFSRNLGISKATGDYVAFLDSDNVWMQNKLENFERMIAGKKDADLIFSRFRQHIGFETIEKCCEYEKIKGNWEEGFFSIRRMDVSSVMYSRKFLNKLNGFPDHNRMHDKQDDITQNFENLRLKFIKIEEILSENWEVDNDFSKVKVVRNEEANGVVSEKKYHLGFTAGAFDLFHIGHLNLLKRCKEQCDYLMVGVMTDEFVKHQKRNRPIIPLSDRMEIVNSIQYVDEVVPVDFHNTVKPDAWTLYHFDVCFSGDDHAEEPGFIWEQKRLRELGSDMVFFPYTERTSSTQIKKLIEQNI